MGGLIAFHTTVWQKRLLAHDEKFTRTPEAAQKSGGDAFPQFLEKRRFARGTYENILVAQQIVLGEKALAFHTLLLMDHRGQRDCRSGRNHGRGLSKHTVGLPLGHAFAPNQRAGRDDAALREGFQF